MKAIIKSIGQKDESTSDSDINWEHRRYELAKAYSVEFVKLQQERGRIECGIYFPNVAEWSVELADTLIEQLKKNKQ